MNIHAEASDERARALLAGMREKNAALHQRVEALKAALVEAKEALEISDCPRPYGRPDDDVEAQVCIAAGECGCCYGTALAKVNAALSTTGGDNEGN